MKKKGTIPAGFANGGKVMPFKGKQTAAEERKEASMVRSGKLTPKEYAAREAAEEKVTGKKEDKSKAMKTGKAIASGKMSPAQYAKKGG